jgi:hypothetical protein
VCSKVDSEYGERAEGPVAIVWLGVYSEPPFVMQVLSFLLQPIAENVSSWEFTFTLIVTIIIPVFVPRRHVRYKHTFSVYRPGDKTEIGTVQN